MRRPKFAAVRKSQPAAVSRYALAVCLESVHQGRMTFDQLVQATMPEWLRLAGILWQAWALPSSVELQDIVQEMLCGAWLAFCGWDAARGVPLHTHVVWNAIARGKRFAALQRKCPRKRGESRSVGAARFALSASSVGVDIDALTMGDRSPVGDCERYVLGMRSLDSHRGNAVIDAVIETRGDLDAAAALLYQRGDATDATSARRLIRDALKTVD